MTSSDVWYDGRGWPQYDEHGWWQYDELARQSGSRPHLSRGASGASGAPHGMQWSCVQMEVDVGKLAEVIVPITPKGSEHEDKDVASSVAVCSARERRDAASSLSAVLLASGIIKRTKRQWNPKKLHWEARVALP